MHSSDALKSAYWQLIQAAIPFVIVNLAGTAFQSLDIYIVKAFYWQPGTPDAVALYAAPFRILNLLLLVPTAWGIVALPRYVTYAKQPDLQTRAFRRDVRISLVMGFALSAGTTVFSRPLTLLALGQSYAASAPILALLAWMTLPVCLSAPAIAVLTVAHRQSWIAICVVIAGIGAIVANNIIVSHDNFVIDNLMKVAIVKVISMLFLLGLYWTALRFQQRSIKRADVSVIES
jgi:O-antigen/teichoic acid export membrane protein